MQIILAMLFPTSFFHSYAQSGTKAIPDCNEKSTLSNDSKLARLASGFDRNNLNATRCAFSYMNDLSGAREPKAMTLIAQYLDLPRVETAEELGAAPQVSHMEMLGGQYPALTYLLRYGKDSLPVLVKTISSDSSFSLNSKNAVRIIMAMESHDPLSGIKLLTDAAKEGAANAGSLTEAAQFAATLYQCKSVQNECNRIAKGESE